MTWLRAVLVGAVSLLAGAAGADPATSCQSQCGVYLPQGPAPACSCYFGSGCCRFGAGCSCEADCAAYGDCCPDFEPACAGPVVTALSPLSAPTGGGVTLTLSGSSLAAQTFSATQRTVGRDVSRIKVGGAVCPIVSHSPTALSCTLPAGAGTRQPVTLEYDANGSTEVVTVGPTFSYDPPRLTGSAPAAVGAGDTLTLSGSSLGGDPAQVTVTLGGSACPVTSASHTELKCTAPVGTGAPRSAVVTVGGQVSSSLLVAYPAPVITSLDRPSPNPAGGEVLTISGTGFGSAPQVTVGGNVCRRVGTPSDTQVACTLPAGAGPQPVLVSNAAQTSAPVLLRYALTLAPASYTGPTAGGTSLVLSGSGFYPNGSRLDFGGKVLTPTASSSTSLTFSVPAGTGTNLALTLLAGTDTYPAGTFSYRPPTITSVSPSAVKPGDAIVVQGSNFAPGATSVTVGGQACPLTGAATYSQATCLVGGPLGQAPQVVVTVAGQSSAGFNVTGPAPVLSGVSPNAGPAAGGITLSLSGSGFGASPTVKVGGTLCPLVGQASDSLLTCTLPAGSGSDLPVTVTASGVATNPLPFSYDPQLTSLAPAHASTAGGVVVTISGSGLAGASGVEVGGAAATLSGTPSATAVSFVLPAGVGRGVPVRVKFGTASSNSLLFDYDAPVLAGLSPSVAAAGAALTLTGTNFGTGAVSISLGGRSCLPSASATETSVTCTVPVGEGANLPVVLTVGGQASNLKTFSYPAPSLSSLSPGNGPTPGGSSVTLSGANLGTSATVLFGGKVVSPTSQGASQIVFTLPPGQGTVSVQVSAGGQLSNALSYTYAAPSLNAVGLAAPGVLALFGSNFGESGAVVTVGGKACPLRSQTHTLVTCLLPAGTGTQTVLLSVGGQSALVPGLWAYPPPTLSGVAPASGPTAGGVPLTLTGTTFGTDPAALAVDVGGAACPVTSASDTQLVCTLPPGQGTNLAVAVNAAGQVSNAMLFSYQSPRVASVSPAQVPAAGGAVVTVSGSDFGPSPALSLDGQAVTPLAAGQGQLTFTAPAGVGATHTLQVKAGDQLTTAAWGYLPPTLTGPVLSTLAPGQTLSLSGTNFGAGGATVRLGDQDCPVTAQVDGALSCTVPDGQGSDLPVVVTAGGQTSNALVFSFAAPVLTGLSPSHGPAAGGIPVTLTGAGWGAPLAVRLGDATVVPDSAAGSSLTFTLPAGGGRGKRVSVLFHAGETNALSFDYDPSAPAARDLSLSTAEDTEAALTLSATDADGDPLSYALVAQPPPGQGTVTLTGDVALYRPAPDFNGTTYFTYRANDGALDSNTATVSVTVAPANDAPVARDVSAATVGQPVSLTLPASDVDGDPLAFAVVDPPAAGEGAVSLAGAVATFTPVRGYSGTAHFTFRANDGQADSNLATATVAVGAAPDAPPVAADLAASTDEDTALTVTLGATDPDGDALSFVVSQPAVGRGVVTLSGAQATYTPPPDFSGTASFTFAASDGVLTSAPATVNVTVAPVNDPPTADSQTASTLEDQAVDIQLTAHDPDGDPLTFAVAAPPAQGQLSLTGSVAHYAPPAGWAGSTSFTFTASDGQAQATGTVTVNVGAVNHAPVFVAPTPLAQLDVVVGELVEFQVAATDPDGTTPTYALVGAPVGASFDAATGQFSWTPAAADVGVHALVLEATDGAETILRGLTIVVGAEPTTSSSGSTGSTGSMGSTIGTTGSTAGASTSSTAGASTGSTGSTGTAGSTSSTGAVGSTTSTTGSTGSAGSTGSVGSTSGTTGSSGAVGSTTTGTTGSTAGASTSSTSSSSSSGSTGSGSTSGSTGRASSSSTGGSTGTSGTPKKKSGCSQTGGTLELQALATGLAWLARRRRR